MRFRVAIPQPTNGAETYTMTKTTSSAIVALLAADPTATEDEKARIAAAIEGKPLEASSPLAGVVTMKEAKRLFQVSRQTLANYRRNGLLVPVLTCGGGRSRGFTRDSVAALLDGRAEVRKADQRNAKADAKPRMGRRAGKGAA